MKLVEIAEMIASIGLPFAYRAFEEGTDLQCPFICYMFTGNSPEPADNKNIVKIETLTIELYTKQKDFALEEQVENVFSAHELVFDRDEEWLSDEKMQMTIYTMEVLINGSE